MNFLSEKVVSFDKIGGISAKKNIKLLFLFCFVFDLYYLCTQKSKEE